MPLQITRNSIDKLWTALLLARCFGMSLWKAYRCTPAGMHITYDASANSGTAECNYCSENNQSSLVVVFEKRGFWHSSYFSTFSIDSVGRMNVNWKRLKYSIYASQFFFSWSYAKARLEYSKQFRINWNALNQIGIEKYKEKWSTSMPHTTSFHLAGSFS